ncbi:hypothetical protein G6F22_018693 [Rhizopus arrhizus]|nr:hypothetical protein G6F22_018693 [Rhizopus arrhizus]
MRVRSGIDADPHIHRRAHALAWHVLVEGAQWVLAYPLQRPHPRIALGRWPHLRTRGAAPEGRIIAPRPDQRVAITGNQIADLLTDLGPALAGITHGHAAADRMQLGLQLGILISLHLALQHAVHADAQQGEHQQRSQREHRRQALRNRHPHRPSPSSSRTSST